LNLETEISSLKLSNPFMNASGVLSTTGGLLKRIAMAGAGAVVTKSLSLDPREGYPNPVVVELPYGYLNAIGLANPGLESFREELREVKDVGVPVIVSVFGSTVEEFARASFKAEEIGADAIELNLSCPHAGGLTSYSQDPKLAYDVIARVKHSVSIPVFAKLSAESPSIVEVAKAVEKAGGDGVTAINTIKAMYIDVDLKRPVLSNKFGGLSGPAIKPIAVRCVYELHEAVEIPIIGVGGISDYRDALEFILAGASAIQVGSALAKEGFDLFRRLINGVEGYLKLHGFSSIKELIGYAHRC